MCCRWWAWCAPNLSLCTVANLATLKSSENLHIALILLIFQKIIITSNLFPWTIIPKTDPFTLTSKRKLKVVKKKMFRNISRQSIHTLHGEGRKFLIVFPRAHLFREKHIRRRVYTRIQNHNIILPNDKLFCLSQWLLFTWTCALDWLGSSGLILNSINAERRNSFEKEKKVLKENLTLQQSSLFVGGKNLFLASFEGFLIRLGEITYVFNQKMKEKLWKSKNPWKIIFPHYSSIFSYFWQIPFYHYSKGLLRFYAYFLQPFSVV